MKETNRNSRVDVLILPAVLFCVSFVFIGCESLDDNSQPSIETITDQTVAVNVRETVEVNITDADDDDTHKVRAASANTSIATVSVNEGNLNSLGTADLIITGIAVGSTTVI